MISNVKEPTVQEAYEAIKSYFSREGAILARNDAEESEYACVYRGVIDGQQVKCAVGCLIPDELYWPEMEGSMAESVIARLGWHGDDLVKFLSYAQGLHDFDAEDVGDFLDRLESLAKQYEVH